MEVIARSKRRRPNAGPQPVVKRPEVIERQQRAETRVKRPPGEPVLPSFRSVVGRTLFAAVFFFVMLTFAFGATPAEALLETLLLTAVMLPLYFLLDRFVHRRRLKRWQARRGG